MDQLRSRASARLATLTATALALAAAPATAQTRSATTTFALALTANSSEAMTTTTGLTADQLRHDGLVLTTTGRGDPSLVVVVLRISAGKIVGHWQSRSFTVTAPGRTAISGRYLPPSGVLWSAWPCKWSTKGSAVPVAQVSRDIESGKLTFGEPRPSHPIVTVILVVPAGASGSDTATSPLFFKSEIHGDGL